MASATPEPSSVEDLHKRTVTLIERHGEILRRKIIFANRSERFSAATELLQTVPGIKDICYQLTSFRIYAKYHFCSKK
jgi:hypothetical protein